MRTDVIVRDMYLEATWPDIFPPLNAVKGCYLDVLDFNVI